MTNPQDTTARLRECPFCANPEPSLMGAEGIDWSVYCDKCGVATCAYTHRDECINAWNTRAVLSVPNHSSVGREKVARNALEQIAQPLDCGCVPCRGQCRSQTALQCELEARQDIAREALTLLPSVPAGVSEKWEGPAYEYGVTWGPAGVSEDGLLSGTGWVSFNPDTGEEYSPNHPIESGECVEAERVRRSTPQEDALWAGMQAYFQRALTSPPPTTAGVSEEELSHLRQTVEYLTGVPPKPGVINDFRAPEVDQAILRCRERGDDDTAHVLAQMRLVYRRQNNELQTALAALASPSPDTPEIEGRGQ